MSSTSPNPARPGTRAGASPHAGASEPALERTLGLSALVFYGVGVIVGAGIYSILGAAVGAAGKAVWISMLLAAIPAVLTALCYAELATMLPQAGASYVYVREALPRWRFPSFGTGFVVAVTGAATSATVALAFGGYLSLFAGIPVWLSALALLAACTALTIAGIRESTWVTVACTTIEVAGLVLIIVFGVQSELFLEDVMRISPAGVLAGAGLVFFVFTGFEGLANLTEETKDPGRHLPPALFLSLAITTVLYVLVALSAVALAPSEILSQSTSPLSDAVRRAAPWAATAVGWIALVSTANTALINVVVTSRQLFGMARGGDMPKALASTLPRRKTPWVAALAIAASSALLLPLGTVALVGSVSSLATLMVFAAVCAALIALRYQRPDLERPFRVPLALGRLPLVPVAAILSIAGLMAQFPAKVYLATSVPLALGVLLYASRRWWAPAPEGEAGRRGNR